MKSMDDNKFVSFLLEIQEWHSFECKRAAVQPCKALETIVAFANSEGGYLVLGMEDPKKANGEKRLIGIKENPENVSELLALLDKEIDPPLKSRSNTSIEITNQQQERDSLIIISIGKSNDVHSLRKGDTFVRRGNRNSKIGATEIIRLKYEKGSLSFEEEASGIESLDDIDQALLKKYQGFNKSEEESDWHFLRDNGLAIKKSGSFQLTKAGCLLFAKNPSIILRNKCGIKISHYYGTKPNFSGEPNFVSRPFSIEGPLLYQIEKP